MTDPISSKNSSSSVDEMKSPMSNDERSKQVHRIAIHYRIDVAKTIADLAPVGHLLKIATAGPKKMTSNEFSMKIPKILLKQILKKN